MVNCLVQISSGYKIARKYKYAVEAGEKADMVLPDNAVVLATKPLYYANRKGWVYVIEPNKDLVDVVIDIETFRAQGVQYFLINDERDLKKRADLKQYLDAHYVMMTEGKGYALYKL